MTRRFTIAGPAASMLLIAAGGSAAAQSPGAVIRGAQGEVLGRVERTIADDAGRPAQVVVRSRTLGGARSTLRALPAASLRPGRGGYVTPLRKAEFEALPPVRR